MYLTYENVKSEKSRKQKSERNKMCSFAKYVDMNSKQEYDSKLANLFGYPNILKWRTGYFDTRHETCGVITPRW